MCSKRNINLKAIDTQYKKNSLFYVVEHTKVFGLCYSIVVHLTKHLTIIKMKKVIIADKEYKTSFDILNDQIRILSFNFVIKKIITDAEWAKSTTKIVDRFNLDIKTERIDGRTKQAKQLPYFSWWVLEIL